MGLCFFLSARVSPPARAHGATVSGIEPADGADVRKRKLRAALVRWHPDKWVRVFEAMAVDERVGVVERVQAITRRILDEKARFG